MLQHQTGWGPQARGGAGSSTSSARPSFRRPRASRACETCHARKVRCDVANLGIPCTNCSAFGVDCRILPPKRQRKQASARADDDDRVIDPIDPSIATSTGTSSFRTIRIQPAPAPEAQSDFAGGENMSSEHGKDSSTVYPKPPNTQSPQSIFDSLGGLSYVGKSANLSLLMQGENSDEPPPVDNIYDTPSGSTSHLDEFELKTLQDRGAFQLPSRALRDELVDTYFGWVARMMPIINKVQFMNRYRDPRNPPSLLLLHAVLMAGSRVSQNPQLTEVGNATTSAATVFYKRAKALIDADYERDRIIVIQASLLMGWYWEDHENVVGNTFYWTQTAIALAQGCGMHSDLKHSRLSKMNRRLWRRIWWTLVSYDRAIAVAQGRPVAISQDEADIDMLSEDDFIETDDEAMALGVLAPDLTQARYFIYFVKLTEIMRLVLSQQYSVASAFSHVNALERLARGETALADWRQNCPYEVHWEMEESQFSPAVLDSLYCTTRCLLHRSHLQRISRSASTNVRNGYGEVASLSRDTAFQSAVTITSNVENLQYRNELRYIPAFMVYSLFSALLVHVIELQSPSRSTVPETSRRIRTCMDALKRVSPAWPVAMKVHMLFELLLDSMKLGEQHPTQQPEGSEDSSKWVFVHADPGDFNKPKPESTNTGPPPPNPSSDQEQGPSQPSGVAGTSSMPSVAPPEVDAYLGNAASQGAPPFRASGATGAPINLGPGIPADLSLPTDGAIPHVSSEALRDLLMDFLQPRDGELLPEPEPMPMDSCMQNAEGPGNRSVQGNLLQSPGTLNVEDWMDFFGVYSG